MPTHKLHLIKNIQVSNNASNNTQTKSVYKNSSSKTYFLPSLNLSENLKTLMYKEDDKLQQNFKLQLNQRYRIRIINHTTHRFVQE